MFNMLNIITLITFSVVPNYTPCCIQAFIDWDYSGDICLNELASLDGNVLQVFNNDVENESIYTVQIIGSTDKSFHVSVFNYEYDFIGKGFIEKAHVCVYSMPYHKSNRIILYSSDSTESKIVCDIENEYKKIFVLDARNSWIKAKVITHNNFYIGWLPPDNQCGDIYTSCCGE